MKTKIAFLFAALVFFTACLPAAAAPDRKRGVDLNQPAPDFTYPDRRGNMISLHDFQGRKVLLYFWVSWCVCRDQLPLLQEYKDANKDKNFEVVSVSIDAQGARYAAPIFDIAGARYPLLLDRRAESARLYHYPASPAMYLIDEAGVVKRQYLVEFELAKPETRAALDAFLAEKPVEAPKAKPVDVAAQIADLEKQVAAAPDKADLRRKLAGILNDAGRPADALPHLVILARNKRSCEDIFSLGSANFALKHNDEALKAWKNAAKCDPTNYIYMRTAQSFETPDMFYTKDKMNALFPEKVEPL